MQTEPTTFSGLDALDAAAGAAEYLAAIKPREFRKEYPYSYEPQSDRYKLGAPLSGALGDCYAHPTSGRHVSLSTESGQRTLLENRGQSYQVFWHAHIYRQPDGVSWDFANPRDPEYPGDRTLGEELPTTARAKLRALVLDAGREWAEANPDLLLAADAAALNNAARNREEKIRKAAAELVELLAELRTIEATPAGIGDDDAPRY